MLQSIDLNDWPAIVLCTIWMPLVLTIHMLWARSTRSGVPADVIR